MCFVKRNEKVTHPEESFGPLLHQHVIYIFYFNPTNLLSTNDWPMTSISKLKTKIDNFYLSGKIVILSDSIRTLWWAQL